MSDEHLYYFGIISFGQIVYVNYERLSASIQLILTQHS